jgi:hypothetical protein
MIPKVLGLAAEGVARHAGAPGFAARLAGEFIERAFTPTLEPGRTAVDILAVLDGLDVTVDMANGKVTEAVPGDL